MCNVAVEVHFYHESLRLTVVLALELLYIVSSLHAFNLRSEAGKTFSNASDVVLFPQACHLLSFPWPQQHYYCYSRSVGSITSADPLAAESCISGSAPSRASNQEMKCGNPDLWASQRSVYVRRPHFATIVLHQTGGIAGSGGHDGAYR